MMLLYVFVLVDVAFVVYCVCLCYWSEYGVQREAVLEKLIEVSILRCWECEIFNQSEGG